MPGIVSPVLLARLARDCDPGERAPLLHTLSVDATLRAARVHGALVARQAAPGPRVLAGATPGTPQRAIFDCEHTMPTRDPRRVRGEGEDPTGDPAADEAYDGLGATYAYFWEVHRRDGLDGAGGPLHGWVHYGEGYDNAFWDGTQMVFGDGRVFDRFTKSLDVIGHELTHGVTEREAGLQYLNQSGALNESVSDVFGSLVKQYRDGTAAADADWLIGADLVKPGFPGTALRSMLAPGTAWDEDDQPAHTDDYVQTMADNGGVHTNSGIPNKAFADCAVALGGKAWERAGLVWYAALRDPGLRPDATFAQFAGLTVAAARSGFDADVATAVRDAWTGVGVTPA